jgi:hypothetical protein
MDESQFLKEDKNAKEVFDSIRLLENNLAALDEVSQLSCQQQIQELLESIKEYSFEVRPLPGYLELTDKLEIEIQRNLKKNNPKSEVLVSAEVTTLYYLYIALNNEEQIEFSKSWLKLQRTDGNDCCLCGIDNKMFDYLATSNTTEKEIFDSVFDATRFNLYDLMGVELSANQVFDEIIDTDLNYHAPSLCTDYTVRIDGQSFSFSFVFILPEFLDQAKYLETEVL